MKDGSKTKKTISAEKIRAVIARVLLLAVACAGIVYAAGTDTTGNTDDNKLNTFICNVLNSLNVNKRRKALYFS